MSSETIVTALFLIAAVVAAGVLINAVFPIISRTTETFGSVAHSTDNQIRTDIKIVNYFANTSGSDPQSQIWLKNIGTSRIPESDLVNSDIFFGGVGNFGTVSGAIHDPTGWWNPGDTLHITIRETQVPIGRWPATGGVAYFAIVLPNGVKRSIEFEAD
ncbi:MAG: flagellin [Methanomicrobiales archaeon]